VVAKAGEVHRRPHQVAGELVQTLGVLGIDRGSVVNAKARIPPGEEKVDALLGDESAVSKTSLSTPSFTVRRIGTLTAAAEGVLSKSCACG
jgi:hypothetical protein